MSNNIIEVLHEVTKEELIDIIEERMYLDPDFRRTLEHRLFTKNISADDQIREFKRQVAAEMEYRSPDTSIIRSAGFALRRNMQSWPVVDFCRACIAIIRTFDDALCHGAGMEDESDFEISMDLEEASKNAVERVQTSVMLDSDRQKVLDLISTELKTPLSVYGSDIFTDIRDALTDRA